MESYWLRIRTHLVPAAFGVGLGLTPALAYAYVDPGIAYAALQGALALFFGVGLAWVMRPWRFFMRLIGRDQPESTQRHGPQEGAATAPKGD